MGRTTLGLALLLLAALPAWAQITVSDDRGAALTLARPAQRIVSLLPSLTETVCELGACGRLVGTDRFSNWPAAVRSLPKLGGLEDAQIERIVSLKPDLVLLAGSARALDRLQALGLPVLALEPRNSADTERVVTVVASALGLPHAATEMMARTRLRMQVAAARVPAAWRGRTVYFEVASTPHAAGEASFIGELLARLGLTNVVPAAMGPFPQLNPEFVLRARPALLMATQAAVTEMPARPGWGALPALQQHHTCGFAPGPWDTLMRPGPRLADAAEAVADCLAALPAPP
jgi:iron complex transport system substrate-binding protein